MDYGIILKNCQLGVGFFPCLLGFSGVLLHKPFLIVISFVILVNVVCLLPLFRKRANLCGFIFVATMAIPVNIYILLNLIDSDLFFYESIFMDLMMGIVYYSVLFSLEQILSGVAVKITRTFYDTIRKKCSPVCENVPQRD